MKKIIKSVILLFLSVLLALPAVPTVLADGEAVITVGKITAAPGETADITVSISSNPGFSALAMAVVCDKDLLTVNNVTAAKELGGQYSFARRYVWFSGKDYQGNGPIFTINVTVSQNARPGDVIPVTLSFSSSDFSNYNENDVPVSVVPGSVTVPGEKTDASDVFKDVKRTDWFFKAVDFVYSGRLMNGTSSDTFAPQKTMSRAMFVTVLWRLDGSPEPQADPVFSDLTADWYVKAVTWANENSIVLGVSPTRFSPDAPLTREQIAAIFFRYASYRETSPTESADLSSFPDREKVSGYALDAVSYAVAVGLIHGTSRDGVVYLDPRGSATRAQVAQIVTNYLS